MGINEKLAGVIRQRYDDSFPGKFPTEISLADFIIEHAEDAGIDLREFPDNHTASAICYCDACFIP